MRLSTEELTEQVKESIIEQFAENDEMKMYKGCKRVLVLFILTIVTSILLHYFLHLPPMIGMMFGFSLPGIRTQSPSQGLHIFSFLYE